MIVFPPLPQPVRQFLRDSLHLLLQRLASLTEEFRAGLIAAVGRTLADGAEHLMDRVIPQGHAQRDHARESEWDDSDESESSFGDYLSDVNPDKEFPEEPTLDEPASMPLTRALIAAGLNAFGVWLLRIGFVPTSVVIAMLGGMVLLFRRTAN